MNMVQSKFVRISDDVVIHYEISGKGDTAIIFTPGWGLSTEVFEHQLAHFANSEKFRAIAYDPRAQGLSSKTMGGHTYQQHARDLKTFIDKLGLKDIILAGWSYGAIEQLAFINQFGADNLKAIIIIDGTPKVSGSDYTKEWIEYMRDDSDGYRRYWTEAFLSGDPTKFYREFAEMLIENPTPEIIKWFSNIVAMTPGTALALLNETGAYLDFEKDLIALDGKIPLLYVVRDERKDLVSNWANEHTPSAEVTAMGMHMMFWERHKEFNEVVDRFLERVN